MAFSFVTPLSSGVSGKFYLSPKFLPAFIFIGIMLFAGTDSYGQTIRYIKPAATGTGTGISWDNASSNLKAMMDTAPANSQIWVAAGSYFPNNGFDRNQSFVLRNQVAVYGGFAGTETALTQRNFITRLTTLTGTIGGFSDDDNSYHVVSGLQGNLDQTAVLDGFNITGGYANTDGGGGLAVANGQPSINNCVFRNNLGLSGGAVFLSNASPTFTNCVFFANGNVNTARGGIFYSEGNGQATVLQCVISAGYSDSAGVSYAKAGGNIQFVNSTIHSNTANSFSVCYTAGSLTRFTNCIIWGNNSFNGEGQGGVTEVTNSFLSFPFAGAGNKVGDPLFTNANNPRGSDGRWFTADDGLRLGTCSPAANTGNNASIALALDILGQNRKFGVVDAGAYEAQVAQPTALFVRQNAPGSNLSGTSWANAYNDLTTALINWPGCPTADSLLLAPEQYYARLPIGFEINKPGGVILGNYDGAIGQLVPGNFSYLYGDIILRSPIRMDGIIVMPKP